MKYIIALGFIIVSGILSAQSHSSHHLIFGSPYSSQVSHVSADAEGNVYVAGEFSKSLLMGSFRFKDTWGGFIAKIDANNKVIWMHQTNVQVRSLEINNNNVYVLAQFSRPSDFCGEKLKNTSNSFNSVVAALNTNTGVLEWSNILKSESDIFASDMCFDNSSGIYITGSYQGVLYAGDLQLTPTHSKNNFFAKLNDSGSIEWINTISGGNSLITGVSTSAMAFDSDSENITITGEISGQAVFGENDLLSEKMKDDYGYEYSQKEVYVATYNLQGKSLDVYTLITEASVSDMLILDGTMYMCGYFIGASQKPGGPGISEFGKNVMLQSGVGEAGNLLETMFVAAFQKDSALWTFAPKGINNNRLYSICADSDKNIYAGGFFYDQIDLPNGVRYAATKKEFSSNMLMLKFNSIGELIGNESAEVKNNLKLFDLSFGRELVIAGQVKGNASVGGMKVASRGKHHNGFLYRYLVN